MMEKELKKANEHYRDKYFNDEIGERIKQKVRQQMNESEKVIELYQVEKKRKWSVGRKIAVGCASCVALFGLFLGSAFVSPAMAEVASNIPFLNSIFHSKPVDQVLYEELKSKGYKIQGIGYTVKDKKYSVSLDGSEEYVNKVKKNVEKIMNDVISSRGYDDYTIEVSAAPKPVAAQADSKEQLSDAAMKVIEEVSAKLKQQNYSIESYGTGYDSPDSDNLSIDVTIADTENRRDDIKKAIEEALQAKNIKVAEVKFYTVNLKEQAIEGQWTSKVLPVIWEGLGNKKEYKTRGFGYSFKHGKFTIIIKTTAEGAAAAELAPKINAAVKDFLNSDDLKSIVNNQPYEVVVEDKSGKNIQ
jgi:hypothetical protein